MLGGVVEGGGRHEEASCSLCHVCMNDSNSCAVIAIMSTLKYMWFVILHSEGEAPNLPMAVCSSVDT